jgi:hypothetical protein
MITLNTDALYLPAGPYLHLIEGEVSQCYDFGLSLNKRDSMSVIVRFLRGRKMHESTGLDNEFAAAMQFPWYYGENWAALDECLKDLGWMPAETYLLLILNSDEVLKAEDPEQFSIFVRILQEVGEEWSTAIGGSELWSRPAIPFHTVLHTNAPKKQELISKLNSVGAVYDEICCKSLQ